MRARRIALWLGKAAVSIAIMAWIAHSLPLDDAIARLAGASPLWLSFALACLLLQLPLSAWRWWRIMRLQGVKDIPYGQALRLFLAGSFVNQTLSVTIGGDALRIWRLQRQGQKIGSAFGGVLLERIAGMAALGVIALLALAAPLPAIARSMLALVLALAVAGVIAALVIPRLAAARILFRGGAFFPIMVISLAIHGLAAIALWACTAALGQTPPPWVYLALAPPALVLVTLPISIAGWGVREGILVAALAPLGLAQDTVLAGSILFGVAVMAAGLAGAPFLFSKRN